MPRDPTGCTERPPRALLLWGRWTPYHHARLRGLRERLPDVLPVQYCAGSRDYGWMRQLEEPGLVTLRHTRCETQFSVRALMAELLPLMVREQPDVVFVPAYWHWSLAAALMARMLGARVITMNESHGGTVRAGRGRHLLRRVAMWLFDAALVGGTPQRRYFETLGLPTGRIVTGYDAVDNAFFATHAGAARVDVDGTRQRLGLPQRYILWAGRMEPKKDVPLLVRAYAEAAGAMQGEPPALLLIGDGVERERVEAAAAELGLPVVTGGGDNVRGPVVRILPFMPPADLAAAYALATCFVLCSRHEEWGLVANEAMAAGTAVLVSSTAGCAEDLLPGPDDPAHPGLRVRRGGLLFTAGDASMLAKSLNLLHSNPTLAERLRQEAQAAVAPFSPSCFGHAAAAAIAAAR